MNMLVVRMMISLALGNLLLAAGVMEFVSPCGIILGGVTGLSLTITHYVPLPLSSVVLAFNVLLFAAGAFVLGRKFAFATIASTLLYPFFMAIFELFPLTLAQMVRDPMLSAVFGGVLMGCGVGLIIRSGGSTGGTDIIALIINRRLHVNLSVLLYIIDGCVLAGQAMFSDVAQILLGIFVLALLTMVMNKLMVMGKTQIQIFIVSDRAEDIRKGILAEEDAGATLFAVEKGYTGQSGTGILCIIPRRKLYSVCHMIKVTDPRAFFIITEVKEVQGQGFSYGMH